MLSSLISSLVRAGPVPTREVLGMNRRNRDLIDQFNLRRHRKLADDKILGKALLAAHGLPVARTYAVIDSMRAVARIEKTVGELEHFVIKPARGGTGCGIAVLGPRTPQGWQGLSGELWGKREIRKQLGQILFGDFSRRHSDRALIEERLFAGPILGDFPVIGLPDIRIITLDSDPVMAMIRLPTKKSDGKANLHLGAVGLGVDLPTGRTTTATWRHRPLTHHPDTKQPISGLQVAAWERVLEIARGAARAFPLPYLGIDIALTRELAPVVVEVNGRPGLEIQNANQRSLRPHLKRVRAAGSRGGNGDLA